MIIKRKGEEQNSSKEGRRKEKKGGEGRVREERREELSLGHPQLAVVQDA